MKEIKKAVRQQDGAPAPGPAAPEEVQLVPKKGARQLTKGTKVNIKLSANSQASLQKLSDVLMEKNEKYVPAPCGLQ